MPEPSIPDADFKMPESSMPEPSLPDVVSNFKIPKFMIVMYIVIGVIFVLGIVSSIYMWNKVKCDPGKIKQNINGTVLCIDPNNPPPFATLGSMVSR